MGLMHSSHNKRAHVIKELERFTKPTGLYPSCAWEDKVVRKLILDGKLAPRFAGLEDKHNGTKECPICFLRHVVLNRTSCCRHGLCTECYLQVRKPKGTSPCPYCQNSKLQILYGTDDEEKMATQELANIRHYDVLTASPQSIPVAMFSSSRSKEEAQEAWAVATQTSSGPAAHAVASPVAPCAASGSGYTAKNSRVESESHINSSRTTAGSLRGSSSSKNSYMGVIPYATVKQRSQIEEEMRKQHLTPTLGEELGENTTAAAAAATALLFSFRGADCQGGGGAGAGGERVGRGGGEEVERRAAQAQSYPRAHEDFVMRRALLESFGVPAHLQHVEDLMLMEAIQRSLEETGDGAGGGGGGGEGGGEGGGGREGAGGGGEGRRKLKGDWVVNKPCSNSGSNSSISTERFEDIGNDITGKEIPQDDDKDKEEGGESEREEKKKRV
ncbi:ring u-box domain-containing protein [Nannochloropsis oceanica]